MDDEGSDPGNLSERLTGLSPERRALLALIQRNRSANPPASRTPAAAPAHLANRSAGQARAEDRGETPPIVPVARGGPLPLSLAQQRLWFLDQLEPGSHFYNSASVVRLSGNLNLQALEQSLNEVIRRHEVLRTVFAVIDREPVQIILPVLSLRIGVIGLRGFAWSEWEAEIKPLASEEIKQPFDLARGPLLRAKLLRLSAREHVFLLTMHHIISDSWSNDVLLNELAVLYQAFSQGEPSPLPELAIQYADFAVWQRQWLQGEVLESEIAFWRRQLGGNLPALKLPADRPRRGAPSFKGAHLTLPLPPSLLESLKRMGHAEDATLFMTLLAGFFTFLYHCTGQDDLIVGTAVVNRRHGQTEGLIGFLVNMLALRLDLSDNPKFCDFLARVRQVALSAYAHQDFPFEKLVEELKPERHTSYSPLVQVAFGLNNAPASRVNLSGLEMIPLDLDTGAARFDLTVWATEVAGGFNLIWTYSTDLFEAQTIQRLHSQFETLLRHIAADPESRLSALELRTADEKEQLMRAREEKEAAKAAGLSKVKRKPISLPRRME